MRNILIISCLLITCCTRPSSQPLYQEVSVETFRQSLDTVKNPTILDVRTPQEFAEGHIQNAININWKDDNFSSTIETLDKSKTVYVYCLSGGRSKQAAATLANAGFQDIKEITGGMMAWRAQNLPEISTQSTTKGMSLEEYNALTKNENLVLVDFYATWCAPCKLMEPYLTRIANDMSDSVTVVKIDADKNKGLCQTLQVSALPVLKLYKQGKEIWQHEGFIDEESVLKEIRR